MHWLGYIGVQKKKEIQQKHISCWYFTIQLFFQARVSWSSVSKGYPHDTLKTGFKVSIDTLVGWLFWTLLYRSGGKRIRQAEGQG